MTGMKEGAGEDPFAENNETSDTDTEETTDIMSESELETEAEPTTSTSSTLPYIARRAVEDEPVTWQRDRLTFYVRDHVEDGERELINEIETALGRNVPKFDVREAAYLVAQQRPEAVLEELEKMGYERSSD